ncbi:hypothetical protein WJX81_008120 [Elliptochloris bilobata]|uniref:CAP-Gly domain-containing protein n=1 Tax=Elliptochloris bilobata TaxID=381761 RepID=A0AAW1SDR2_9CHLO
MLTGADIQALKAYVQAPGNHGQNQAESTVRLHVTHSNLKAEFMELRLDLHMTVEAVKAKLSTHCGTPAADMRLQLHAPGGGPAASLCENHRMLGFYSPQDGWVLHVQDTNPHSLSAHGWLEDTRKVVKYVMSDEDYARRENTYRSYKERRRQDDPEWTAEKELCMRRGLPYSAPAPKQDGGAAPGPEHQATEAAAIPLGSRCEVDPGAKRGVVRYVGKVAGLPAGWWVGVHFDEPVGKNDGSVKGTRYFECPASHGGLVRPDRVCVGDFPEIDAFAFSSDDEI